MVKGCNEKTKKKIDETIDRLYKVIGILNEIKNGAPVGKTLDQYKISATSFFKLINCDIFSKVSQNNYEKFHSNTELWEHIKAENITLHPAEKLWYALGYDGLANVPSDINETIESIIKVKFSKRDNQVIRMYYWEDMTLDEIANKLNVSREAIRQSQSKALRKIKYRIGKLYGVYGDTIYRKIKNERLENEIKHKKELLDKLEKSINYLNNKIANRTEELIDLKEKVGEPILIETEEERLYRIYHTKVEDLELSVRAYNILRRNGIQTVRDICERTEAELLSFRKCGITSVNEIKRKLNEFGLKLKENNDEHYFN